MISKTIKLWDNIAYDLGKDEQIPYLDTYVLEGDKKRGAVLVCPGGGYGSLSEREGEPIALQFNAAGFHAFVVYYRVAPSKHPKPLLDVSRAMCLIRENAIEWKVDSEKIAVCGFSAGGHLTASIGVHWNKEYIKNAPGIKEGMNRPDALILSYPVISSGEYAHRGSFENLLGRDAEKELLNEMSLELQVSQKTPPSFIWHTFDDSVVPVENSLLFARALRNENIPFEMHIFPKGPHGLSLATEETGDDACMISPAIAKWMELCVAWLKNLFR